MMSLVKMEDSCWCGERLLGEHFRLKPYNNIIIHMVAVI